jgi:hypothetical protein
MDGECCIHKQAARFSFTIVVRQMASAHSHRAFRFDPAMKFEHHHSRLSPQPVAVAEL